MSFKKIVSDILLLESQESESIKRAKRLVMDKLGVSSEEADKLVRIDIRGNFPVLRSKRGGKFILGVTRMSLDGALEDGSDISKLNRIIGIILDGHYDEYDRDLNGMSKGELFARFSSEDRALSKAQKDEVDNLGLSGGSSGSGYRIVKIDSFKESSTYNKFLYAKDPWCVTYSEENYNAYTSNGANQIYFCLRDGFERLEPRMGEGCPLDEYGLSMISVIVDEEGNLLYSTTRWNHSNGGSDNALSPVQISKILNVNFFDTFKPSGKFGSIVSEIERRLAEGEPIDDIVDIMRKMGDDLYYISVMDRDNVIYGGKILSKVWVDGVDYFNDVTGMIKVHIGSRENLLSLGGFFVCPATANYSKWHKSVVEDEHYEGIVYVKDNGKCNFYNHGRLVLPFFVDDLEYFFRDLATIRKDNLYNMCDVDGNLLCKSMWFDEINDFLVGDKTFVKKDGRINMIDIKGNLLAPNTTDTSKWGRNYKEMKKIMGEGKSSMFGGIVKSLLS